SRRRTVEPHPLPRGDVRPAHARFPRHLRRVRGRHRPRPRRRPRPDSRPGRHPRPADLPHYRRPVRRCAAAVRPARLRSRVGAAVRARRMGAAAAGRQARRLARRYPAGHGRVALTAAAAARRPPRRAPGAAWVRRPALAGWGRQRKAAKPEDWPADTPQDMAAWLSQRLQRLAAHPAAPEAHGEICGAVRAAQRVTDRPAERQFAGRCGCGRALYAKPGARTVRCRDCDAQPLDVEAQAEAMLAAIADQLMTAVQAADVLTRLAAPLSADLVRKWADRGHITPRGRDMSGRPLYRVSDVLGRLLEKLE